MEADAAKKQRQVDPDPQDTPASLDLISHLPYEMIDIIISYLPTKFVVRTTILSKAVARNLGLHPLKLTVDCDLVQEECQHRGAVSKILAAHPGPAKILSIGFFHGRGRDLVDRKFDNWFRSGALDGLEDFTIHGGLPLHLLPQPVFHFAPTLRIARISSCYFPDFPAGPALIFPKLKQLQLYLVVISMEATHRLITSYIGLEGLHLEKIYGLSSLCIVSHKLRTVGVSGSREYIPSNINELVIQDAPCLERLLIHELAGQITINVLDAPKLTVLGYVSNGRSKLVIGAIIIKNMIPTSLTWSMQMVKILALSSFGPNLDAIVGLLRCFPCMEKLYIESDINLDMKNVVQYNPLYLINCLELHLREVSLNDYRGRTPDIDFAKFFILNAKMLKVMRFGIIYEKKDRWLAARHKKLQLDKKASVDAKFEFRRVVSKITQFLYTAVRNNTHDRSVDDPFEGML